MTNRTVDDDDLPWRKPTRAVKDLPALVILWSLEEPSRVGEVALIHGAAVLGRGPAQPEDAAARLVFSRQRPGATLDQPALGGTRISRIQLRIKPRADGALDISSVGKCAMLVRSAEVKRATVAPGETFTIKNALVLQVIERPPVLAPLQSHPEPTFAFGEPDSFGVVGESPAAWQLRDALAFAAGSPHHVLLQGESGVGKELAARSIHGLSARKGKTLIARNAATFPEGLVDAELFGNAKGYPNTGNPERSGLVGEADGSTLFLDEIGELPQALQAHLLRVLDSGGEYQRLGESRSRTSNLRLIAATNRDLEALKHDFAARLTVRVSVPPLDERREDIPLLVRHLAKNLAKDMPDLNARFFEEGVARIDPSLIEGLAVHRYTHHLRELGRLVWLAASTSREVYLARTKELEAELRVPGAGDAEIDEGRVREALAAADGNVTHAARALGLKNRFALYRIMRRYGIAGAQAADDAGDS